MTELLIGLILAGAGYTLRWAQDRAEQRRRFARSIIRTAALEDAAAGWRTNPPKWADDPDWIIDLRDPPEVKP